MLGCATEALFPRVSAMSSPIKGSQQPPTTKSGPRKVGAPLGSVPANKSPSSRPELVGVQYGSVTIISPELQWVGKEWNRKVHVFTRCNGCGAERWISLGNLERGRTKGCRACNQPVRFPKWLYVRMQGAEQRCTNPNSASWPDYGARGITFDFAGPAEAALWVQENLGLPDIPAKAEIDRIDNDKGYAPGNLRWSTRQVNQSHTRASPNTARMHKFRMEHPEVKYADATLTRMIGLGMTDEQIVDRFNKPSSKPKGKYGTFSTPDPAIVSLLKGS